MYKVTDELKQNGFSMNPAHVLISRNQGKREFYIYDHFIIHLVRVDTKITIEEVTYDLSKGDIVFIGPCQNVIFGKEYELENSVDVIAYSLPFYEKTTSDTLLNYEVFFHHPSKPLIIPSSRIINELIGLYRERVYLYGPQTFIGLCKLMVHNFIETLLLEGLVHIKTTVGLQIKKEYPKTLTAIQIVNKFRILLQENHKEEKQVGFYAEKLHVTPRHLADIVKTTLGKSAKQIIIDKVVSECYRRLRHSDHSISEIAYELGFNDEGNFSTFIRTHTGMSPSELRESILYENKYMIN